MKFYIFLLVLIFIAGIAIIVFTSIPDNANNDPATVPNEIANVVMPPQQDSNEIISTDAKDTANTTDTADATNDTTEDPSAKMLEEYGLTPDEVLDRLNNGGIKMYFRYQNGMYNYLRKKEVDKLQLQIQEFIYDNIDPETDGCEFGMESIISDDEGISFTVLVENGPALYVSCTKDDEGNLKDINIEIVKEGK